MPQDVPGLVGLFGGGDAFAAELWAVLANQTQWVDNGTGCGTILPNPYYWAGNEPDILAPWLFPFAGAAHAWRTQLWTRALLRMFYTPDADGIPGNDDYGAPCSACVCVCVCFPLG